MPSKNAERIGDCWGSFINSFKLLKIRTRLSASAYRMPTDGSVAVVMWFECCREKNAVKFMYIALRIMNESISHPKLKEWGSGKGEASRAQSHT